MYRQGRFCIMPLLLTSILSFFISILLDWMRYYWYHYLELKPKIDDNGPILTNLWLGEVQCCDGEFRGQHSTSPNNTNIGLFSKFVAYSCSWWYYVLSSKSRRWYIICWCFSTLRMPRCTTAFMVDVCCVLCVVCCVASVVVVGVCGRPSSLSPYFWREIGVSAFTDKKGRRHPEIVSAESGVSGPNCRHHPVSPTCRRHVADICS